MISQKKSVNNVQNGYFMYFRKTMTLDFGDNNLDIIMKNKFSEITTSITLDPSLEGDITEISDVTITPTNNSASISLNDGVLAYNNTSSPVASVLFPELGAGASSITSTPTIIINPATPDGILNIGSITINGVTKTNLSIPGLNITPGVKYKLNLTLRAHCTADVNLAIFNTTTLAGSTVPDQTKVFQVTDTDDGFVLDITRLDNSFNLTINGTPLISKAEGTNNELQFYPGNTAIPRNIEFSEGGVWGEGTIPNIWQLTGTQTNPAIRVVVSPTGNVSMYGSESSGGTNGVLSQLTLINGDSFNHIDLNSTGTNTVILGQISDGPSVLVGHITGKKIVPCTL